jgi:hypothetical protein
MYSCGGGCVLQLSKHLSTHWDEAEALELYRVHLDALAASPVGATDVALALVETTRFLTVHGTPAEVCEAVAHAVRRVEQIHGDHHAALLPMLQQSAALAERDGPSLYALNTCVGRTEGGGRRRWWCARSARRGVWGQRSVLRRNVRCDWFSVGTPICIGGG